MEGGAGPRASETSRHNNNGLVQDQQEAGPSDNSRDRVVLGWEELRTLKAAGCKQPKELSNTVTLQLDKPNKVHM